MKKRGCGEQPIIHRWKKVGPRLEWLRAQGTFYKKFRRPEDLSIVTVHNYDTKSIFEESLDFFGVEDYIVLKHKGKWRHMLKFELLLDYINSGKCETEYLLLCDARDCVLSSDPGDIIPIFKTFDCDLIFNATLSRRGIFQRQDKKGWGPLYWWGRKIAKTGRSRRLLNSGAFVGRVKFIAEVMEIAVRYPPVSVCPDQDILRAIHPWFHPRLKIDYYNHLFYRN